MEQETGEEKSNFKDYLKAAIKDTKDIVEFIAHPSATSIKNYYKFGYNLFKPQINEATGEATTLA